MTEQFYYLCWMLGHSASKALPTSHVVPFTNDTLITFYPLHPAGISPNCNCTYPVTRSAQYRTQRNHCSGPLYKGSSLVPTRTELKANPELPPRCCWSCSQWPCWPWAQLRTWFLVRIMGEGAETLLGAWGITLQWGSLQIGDISERCGCRLLKTRGRPFTSSVIWRPQT